MKSKQSVTTKQLVTFGIAFSLFLALLGYIQFRNENELSYNFLWGVAILNLVTTLTYPGAIKPLYRVAMFIAHILGWVNTRLLLGLIYYLVFTPIAIVIKLTGRDPLDRKFDRNAPTYWKTREKTESPRERYLKQF
ncbi:MAG: SxtJ family membrane protein [Candidatus Zhuqueibacterota bacterium]